MKELLIELFSYLFLLLRVLAFVALVTVIRRLVVHWKKVNQVAVVVLGDIGRSPRMQYHSLSLASHGYKVHLVGFSGSTPHGSITNSNNIEIHHVKEAIIRGVPRLVAYLLKVVMQSLYLVKTLMWDVGATESILIQNPPCIPGMAVCLCISVFNGSKLIIDWHNYGYSILAMTLGRDHLLVKVAKCYEEFFGQLSSDNLCVTRAMSTDLQNKWNINAKVMHDRPGPLFKPVTNDEKHKLYNLLAEKYPEFRSREGDKKSGNKFTYLNENGQVSKKSDRPAIIISSTSWTEDEDFSILIDALEMYELEKTSSLPDILCVVTGKGPMKEFYKGILAKKEWKHVQVVTPWLEAEDYPTMLASSDFGVSLHSSSSGLDLPMKVVDMFGSQLPVLALNFSCLDELVVHGENGYVFSDSQQFKKQLVTVLSDFSGSNDLAEFFRGNVDKFRSRTWMKSWNEIVLPCFGSSLPGSIFSLFVAVCLLVSTTIELIVLFRV